MNRISMLLVAVAAFAFGCGDNLKPGTPSDGPPPPPPDSGGNPPPPALGTMIDRMGRPAINTALNNPFNPDTAHAGMRKQAYNELADRSMWGTQFGAEFAISLGLIDALDDMCGNQAGADPQTPEATRYNLLAGLLADDELYVNSSTGMCLVYLAVEARALVPAVPVLCGGRKPSFDVIDVSYTALVKGIQAVIGMQFVTDGVNADDGAASDTDFPFFGAPAT